MGVQHDRPDEGGLVAEVERAVDPDTHHCEGHEEDEHDAVVELADGVGELVAAPGDRKERWRVSHEGSGNTQCKGGVSVTKAAETQEVEANAKAVSHSGLMQP